MNSLPSFQTLFFGLFFVVKIALSKRYGLVEITASNYQSLVIDGGKDAWIVAVKGAGKVSLDEWRETEFNLRGLFVRVGIIDPKKDGAFLKRKVSILSFLHDFLGKARFFLIVTVNIFPQQFF